MGFCTYVLDGSPCSHQAAVAINFRKSCMNFIPSMHPESRRLMAHIALGEKAENDLSFYAAVSQASDEKTICDDKLPDGKVVDSHLIPVEDSMYDIIEEMQTEEEASVVQNSDTLTQVMEEMTNCLQQKDQDFNMVSGIETFVKKYQDMCTGSITAKLASALHQFAWSPEKKLCSTWFAEKGYRIPVLVTAAREGTFRGIGTVTSGGPPKT